MYMETKNKEFLMDLINLEESVGDHILKNLRFESEDNKDVILGEIANKDEPDNFEEMRWTLESNTIGYYCGMGGDAWDLDLEAKGLIYDDTGRGDTFLIRKRLFTDKDVILCEVVHEDYSDCLKVLIDKKNRDVSHPELNFYLFKINEGYEHSFR